MSKQRVFRIWMFVLALVLLTLLKAVVFAAAPDAVPALGLTPTPTWTTPVTPPSVCEPSIRKQASTDVAYVGDEVVFTIKVKNTGERATVRAHVVDIVPDDFEILENGVTVQPEDKVEELFELRDVPEMDENPKIDGQKVTVYLKPLSHGDEVTVVIRTRRNGLKDIEQCVVNEAWFYTDNCGDPLDLLPVCGEPKTSNVWWMLAFGLAIGALALRLALSQKWRIESPRRA